MKQWCVCGKLVGVVICVAGSIHWHYELKQNCCFLPGCRVRLTASNIISRLTPSRRLISRRDKLAIGCYVSSCALPVDSRVVLAFRISSASQEWINRRPPRRFLVFRRKNLYVCHTAINLIKKCLPWKRRKQGHVTFKTYTHRPRQSACWGREPRGEQREGRIDNNVC